MEIGDVEANMTSPRHRASDSCLMCDYERVINFVLLLLLLLRAKS